MVTVISRFRVRNGLEEKVRTAFLNRPRLVETSAGFCGLDVLTDATDPSIFLLVTRWTDEESFRAWHRSDAHHQSHQFIPEGLKLDAAFTSLIVGNSILDPVSSRSLSDSIEGQTLALSKWLMESDALLALLVSVDGTILYRNPTGHRLFPPDQVKTSHASIWDYLTCSHVEPLRQRFAGSTVAAGSLMLLNLDGKQNTTLEVAVAPSRNAILLLGTEEHGRDSTFQTEMLKLTNDLSVMARESNRKNRELQEAKTTIERLARTDALTGLANRRELKEALCREIARAGRLSEELCLIIVDVDHFKSINDEYGHTRGDQVLARVASVLAGQLRSYDLAARYGGEEFVILLPATPTNGAIRVAERVRVAISEAEVPNLQRKITISLGVATWLRGETEDAFIARADAALYNAKRNGRNRVEVA